MPKAKFEPSRPVSGSDERSANPSTPATDEAATEKPPLARADAQTEQDGRPRETGGPPGPDPTRYGDWEKNGRCIDF